MNASRLLNERPHYYSRMLVMPDNADEVYFPSNSMGMTRDGGETSEQIAWGGDNHDMWADPANPSRLMIGSDGGVHISTTRGRQWSFVRLPIGQMYHVATNDGQVQVTRNGGKNWSNVTGNLRGLPPKGTVSSVEPSRFRPGTAYLAIDLHQVDNRDPFLFKTSDYGESWKAIASNIPRSQLSYAHVLRECPHRQGLLFAGTENGLYVSFDDFDHWEPLQSKLPHAPVHWLTIQEQFHDLVVGTYGRGFYILDDVTPLEQLTREVRGMDARLFAPRPAYRFRKIAQRTLVPAGTVRGQDPDYGATINYWLKEPVKAPSEAEDAEVDRLAEDATTGGARKPVKRPPGEIVILEAGHRLRVLTGSNKAGMNRVAWDLRTVKVQEVRLRTTPAGNPRVWEENGRLSGVEPRRANGQPARVVAQAARGAAPDARRRP